MSTTDHIPYGPHTPSEADIQAVVDELRSEFLTQGPVVPAFEEAVSSYCQSKHGVALNGAASALLIASSALVLEPGDWLWINPITFVASAKFRRSLYFVKELKAGEVITYEHVLSIRPGYRIPPNFCDSGKSKKTIKPILPATSVH